MFAIVHNLYCVGGIMLSVLGGVMFSVLGGVMLSVLVTSLVDHWFVSTCVMLFSPLWTSIPLGFIVFLVNVWQLLYVIKI